VRGTAETKAIAEEAYVYGFLMIATDKATYEISVDNSSGGSTSWRSGSPCSC
jgi:hypothetical protein